MRARPFFPLGTAIGLSFIATDANPIGLNPISLLVNTQAMILAHVCFECKDRPSILHSVVSLLSAALNQVTQVPQTDELPSLLVGALPHDVQRNRMMPR